MAALTRLWDRSLNMVGIGCALEVFQVAGYATGVGQVVVSIDMALRTLQRDVRSGQRESGC